MSVDIGNWGAGTYLGANMSMYNTMQTNHGKWYKTYIEQQEEWREEYNKWRKLQLVIAGLQQVAALYFANKQYQAAKEAQAHQNEVWRTEKEWAKRYQDLWFNKYRPIEEKFLKEKAEAKPYVAKYDESEARAVTDVRREFAMARDKIRRCLDPRCIGISCSMNKQLAIAEARAAVGAINKGYRAEEARKDIKDAQRDEIIFSLLKLGRGLQSASLGALDSAAAAAKTAATYKPYSGYESAVGMIGGYWHGYTADRAGQAQQNASIYSRQASNYAIGQGYTGNTASSSATIFNMNAQAVSGTNGSGGYSFKY